MKRKVLFIFALVMTLSITGCKSSHPETDNVEDPMFVKCYEGGALSIYSVVYHKKTKVMYAVSTGAYNGGNFTLLVNPDGTPQLYEEE